MRWRDNEKAFEFTVLLTFKASFQKSKSKNKTYTILSSMNTETPFWLFIRGKTIKQ